MPHTRQNSLLRLRIKQIRATSAALSLFQRIPLCRPIISLIGLSRIAAEVLVGYRRTFVSLQEAGQSVAKYRFSTQDHPDCVRRHLDLGKCARPSDYAVLFYLRGVIAECRSILDIGGSAGNLFYCYSKYLEYPHDLSWTVYELATTAEIGRKIAEGRSEEKLRFISDLKQCGSADVMLISGALHYFEQTPVFFMKDLSHRPRHVLVNRTPISSKESLVTVQDAGVYLAPARIIGRNELLKSMRAADYDLVDEWTAPELGIRLPLHPDRNVPAYSGFYFRSREACSE